MALGAAVAHDGCLVLNLDPRPARWLLRRLHAGAVIDWNGTAVEGFVGIEVFSIFGRLP
jgi:hypothetical protein